MRLTKKTQISGSQGEEWKQKKCNAECGQGSHAES